METITGITTNGRLFKVYQIKDEIIYKDEFGDTLTWHYNDSNKRLVLNMVNYITLEEVTKEVS